jgi:quercetin dioxygenase-like cupin family protein
MMTMNPLGSASSTPDGLPAVEAASLPVDACVDMSAALQALLAALPAPPIAPSSNGPLGGSTRLKSQLLQRARRALQASAGFVTHRGQAALRDLDTTPAAGVTLRTLSTADSSRLGATTLRPGQASLSALVELAPGTAWRCELGATGAVCEWLVMQGELDIDGTRLQALDFRRQVSAATKLQSANGAQAYLRVVSPGVEPGLRHASSGGATPLVQRDAPELWHDFAPRIRRRILHSDSRCAAMLYRAEPCALVPHHGHGHDEECLMLKGELFLDDVLLRAGEFQLAPAGSEHHEVFTDTGCLLYAHGDLELALR